MKAWKGRETDMLPVPKSHLGYPEIIETEPKRWEVWAGQRSWLYGAVQGMGQEVGAGRNSSEEQAGIQRKHSA